MSEGTEDAEVSGERTGDTLAATGRDKSVEMHERERARVRESLVRCPPPGARA
jgi:hypothetical protein